MQIKKFKLHVVAEFKCNKQYYFEPKQDNNTQHNTTLASEDLAGLRYGCEWLVVSLLILILLLLGALNVSYYMQWKSCGNQL